MSRGLGDVYKRQVMYEGEIVGQLNPNTVSVEELGLYMAGAKKDKIPVEAN